MRKTLLAAAAARVGFPLLLSTLASTTVSAQEAAQKAAEPTASATEAAAAEPAEVIVIASGSQVDLSKPYAGGQVAQGGRVGLFGNLDVMDTPFNSTNYTADLIRNQQSRSVADVVQNDPAVRVARGFGNFQELYVIRGFPMYSDDLSFNGLYGLLPRQYVAAELMERIEVLRGANSFLNGAAPGGSSVGGTINLVPKRAPDEDLNRITVGYESDAQAYATADVARRFGDNNEWGMRANGIFRDGETAVDDEERRLGVGSLGLDYRGDRFRLSADVGYQDQRADSPRPSLTPVGTSVPDAPDAKNNFAQDWTYAKEKDLFGVARGEYDVTQNTVVWGAFGMRDTEEHNLLANPNVDADGKLTAYAFENYREDLVTTGEIGLRTEFKTGSVGHRLSLSANAYQLDLKNAYAFGNFSGYDAGTMDNPQAITSDRSFFTGGVMNDPLTTEKTETSSVAVADLLAFFDKRLLALVGARYQAIDQKLYNIDSGDQTERYDESTVTPVFALVVKPSSKVSLYANYAQALQRGQSAPSNASNPNAVLKPFKSEQYEVGSKYDGGNLGATVALFRIDQQSGIVDSSNVFGANGIQRHQGVELSWFGQPLDGYRVLGGFTYIDAEMRKTTGGLNEGERPTGVPKTQANLGVEYDLQSLAGLTLDARVVYTGSQTASADGSLDIPSWTRFDLGSRYAFNVGERNVTLRARIDNVAGRDYWASAGGFPGSNYLVLAAPRTFTLSASVDF